MNNDKPERLQLEGRNPVLEAINHDKSIDKILFKKGEIEGTLKMILAKAKAKGIVTQEVARQKLDEISETGNHQGVIALCPAYEYCEVPDMLAAAKENGATPFLLILDGITDPYNLGAVIRTAEACGVHGIIIPKRRAVGITGVAAKASAGAAEHVRVARVNNLSRVIEDLKKDGFWVACADMDGQTMYKSSLTGPLAIVIGGEGEGVSRLVKEKCDFTVSIPMYGKIGSLNASVAAGVLMYEAVRQRER